MTAHPFRRALRALLPADGPGAPAQTLVVQHLGFECSDLDTLPAVLDEVGRELGVALTLDGISGDVVLAERSFVARVAPQVLNAFLDDRPLVTVPGLSAEADLRRRGREIHVELLRQLRELSTLQQSGAAVATPLPAAGQAYDSQFDSRQHADRLVGADLDPDRAELLNRVRRGLTDPSQPILEAGYGPKAALALDFSTGVAYIDELADQRLRLIRDLPYLARSAQPEAGCKQRELDLVVWDIAVAAGDFRLLNSPVNWWHTSLLAPRDLNVSRFTVMPQHLEMARALAARPASPADLRRRCRVGLADLRSFLQGCLFLGLIKWSATDR